MAGVDSVPPASEPHGFDGQRGQAGFRHLNGEVVLVTRLVRPLASLFVDADDVVYAAAVAGHADHGRRGRRCRRKQQIAEHADAGAAVEHDLFAPVPRERARVEW
ncbi:MAG: hypothetical protein DMF98_19605 [Acidobacteria bacterium]|nr:MAG: hypothetical protein DMF98_19605 [Acidobacteriota bacterium]